MMDAPSPPSCPCRDPLLLTGCSSSAPHAYCTYPPHACFIASRTSNARPEVGAWGLSRPSADFMEGRGFSSLALSVMPLPTRRLERRWGRESRPASPPSADRCTAVCGWAGEGSGRLQVS